MSYFKISTDRLILRHPIISDAIEINRAKNEVWDELHKWMIWAYDEQKTMHATESFIRNIGKDSLVGFCKDSGKFVVSTGLMTTGKPDEYATGYWVAKDFLGKGYATEATAACIHFAFTQLSAKAIHIGYLEGNDKSKRIIEKLGFENETIKSKSFARCSDQTLVDEHEFYMTDTSRLLNTNYAWCGNW
jgi:RimJ/RimL family protein N-acetyltransferase